MKTYAIIIVVIILLLLLMQYYRFNSCISEIKKSSMNSNYPYTTCITRIELEKDGAHSTVVKRFPFKAKVIKKNNIITVY